MFQNRAFLRNQDIDDSYLDLLEDILECINEESGNAFYGFRRVYHWLRIYKGYSGSMYKIHKIMKENGLLVKKQRKSSKSRAGIDRNSGISDQIERNFYSKAPNEVFLLDITEGHCRECKYYLCAVIDCFDGSVRGYSVDNNM